MPDSETQLLEADTHAPGRLTLPALVLARFITMFSLLIAGLLLIDIGNTFNLPVGVTGQIQTVASLIAAITAVLMGVVSVRYTHKSLLVFGVLAYCISMVGCSLAPNFAVLLIVYALSGLGVAMITPMALALVATHLPLEQRASAIGWITASPGIAAMVGAPIISILAGVGGWRWVFLGLGFSISFVSLVIAIKGIPTPEHSLHPSKSQGQYWEAFKEVFANRSALACLMGTALIVGAYAANQVYSLSFFRETFALSVGFTSILLIIGALSFVLGSLISGKVISQFGRKPVSILTACLMGGFIIAYMNVAHFGLAIILSSLSAVFGGIVAATSSGLTLEQVPQYRGTMMSMHYAAWSLGTAVGTGVGGAALLLYSYGMLGLILGSFGLVAALVFYTWARDPTQEG